MKTKEELNALKEEVETLNKKLKELSEEELEQVAGGVDPGLNINLDLSINPDLAAPSNTVLSTTYTNCPFCGKRIPKDPKEYSAHVTACMDILAQKIRI